MGSRQKNGLKTKDYESQGLKNCFSSITTMFKSIQIEPPTLKTKTKEK